MCVCGVCVRVRVFYFVSHTPMNVFLQDDPMIISLSQPQEEEEEEEKER